jgi:hypothetical protein
MEGGAKPNHQKVRETEERSLASFPMKLNPYLIHLSVERTFGT